MESLSSCNLTQSPSDPLHVFHHGKPLHKGKRNDSFKIMASPAPFHPRRKKPKDFLEKDIFPHCVPVQSKNPHVVYRDIQRFAKQNKLKEALAILDYLDHRGIPTNATTFAALISACLRVKSIEAARQVHAHIRINSLENNEFLQTKLVHMYACCGSMVDAKKVFESMPVNSVYPWNALLRGNVVSGRRHHREALDSFSEMRASGVELNVYSFSCLIKSLAGARSFRQGLKTHGVLVKNGLYDNIVVKTSLIDMYFKCGKIRLACSLFEEIDERDVVLWGAMIAGFAHNRLQKEALDYTRWMVDEGIVVNSVILTIILPIIGELSARKIGQEAHAYVIKTKEYSKHMFIQSALIDMYCKCGDMVSGRKVFYGTKERNTVSWTALLSGYAENGRLEQALRCIIWMQQEGSKPDLVTIATALPVCGKLGALKQGKEIHSFAIKNGFSPTISVATSLMMMYSKCNILEYSVKVFDTMEKKSVVSWTAMIDCYIESQRLSDALHVFRSMQQSKHRPDSVTIARMLSVCKQLKDERLGKEIHGQAIKKDVISVPFVSAEIVRMYGNCGGIDKANLAFEGVAVKGSIMWTAIIEAYGYKGLYKEAMHLFEKMMADGFTPNGFTFKVVLRVCADGGFVEDAKRYFNLMTRRYNVKADEEHYCCIIDLFARMGRAEEAERYTNLLSLLA